MWHTVNTITIYQTEYRRDCICYTYNGANEAKKEQWGKKACDFSFCLVVVFVFSAVVHDSLSHTHSHIHCVSECVPVCVRTVKMDLYNLPLNFTETSTRYTLFRSSIHQRKGSIAIDWTRPYKGKGSRKIQRIHLHKSQYNGILSSFSPSGLI